jgi:hypothetical protein
MVDLQREYEELLEEVRIGSVATSELQITEFFHLFSVLSAENGDTPDMEYCPILKEGSSGYRIDGYAFGFLEGDGTESGDLYLAVCDYRQDDIMPGINKSDIDKAVNGAIRFFKATEDKKFLLGLEEASPAYQLAILLHQYRIRVRRLRVILFTNGHLRLRSSIFEVRDLGSVSLHVNVLDIDRYAKITSQGREPVEVEFKGDLGDPIECIPASIDDERYKSYLFAISGNVLANVFAKFDNRLLEQNVRTYLQAKTKVNKGILNTISKEPGMFFAYNNGITATASEVSICKLADGGLAINRISDFQVVNGGQTTASLLYARDSMKLSLERVHVQVKLSVVDDDNIGDVVPKISEYANTQNKVSAADLASNSPAQTKIKRLSKDIQVPMKAGELHGSKWFYERVRGEYKSLFSYKTKSEKTKLELLYPKSQLITKTDLAKYELSFEGQPHHVSDGAQKCFSRYVEQLPKVDVNKLTEVWFRRIVAKCILFKRLDENIQRSKWYVEDRGYKAQIVTYTIAVCADSFRTAGYQIDLDRIWREQSVSEGLLSWLMDEARMVANIIKNPPSNVRNITEFAKREFCWLLHVRGKAGTPLKSILQYGVTLHDFIAETKLGVKEQGYNNEVDFDIAILGIVSQAAEIKVKAEQLGLASPKNINALTKLAAGKVFSFSKAEKNALKFLLERLEVEY